MQQGNKAQKANGERTEKENMNGKSRKETD
jgi:hypothetical protein